MGSFKRIYKGAFKGIGFRVLGLGFRVLGFGFGVSGLGFRVRFRVWGRVVYATVFGATVWGFGL